MPAMRPVAKTRVITEVCFVRVLVAGKRQGVTRVMRAIMKTICFAKADGVDEAETKQQRDCRSF
jgi:hypothetical protein